MTTGNMALIRQTYVGKVMSLLFNMLSRLVIAFLPRRKHIFISWLKSPSAVILEPRKIKTVTVSIVSPSYTMKRWDQMPWSSFFECWVFLVFFVCFFIWMLSFKPAFSLSSFTYIKRLSCIYKVIDISPSNLDSSLCFFQPSILHDVFCI